MLCFVGVCACGGLREEADREVEPHLFFLWVFGDQDGDVVFVRGDIGDVLGAIRAPPQAPIAEIATRCAETEMA